MQIVEADGDGISRFDREQKRSLDEIDMGYLGNNWGQSARIGGLSQDLPFGPKLRNVPFIPSGGAKYPKLKFSRLVRGLVEARAAIDYTN